MGLVGAEKRLWFLVMQRRGSESWSFRERLGALVVHG